MHFLPLPAVLFTVLLLTILTEFGIVHGWYSFSALLLIFRPRQWLWQLWKFWFSNAIFWVHCLELPKSGFSRYGQMPTSGVGFGTYPQSSMGYSGYPGSMGTSLIGGASPMVSPFSSMGGVGGIGGAGMYSPYGGSSMLSPYSSMGGLGTSGFGGGLGGIGGNSQSALLSNYYGSIMSGMMGKRWILEWKIKWFWIKSVKILFYIRTNTKIQKE